MVGHAYVNSAGKTEDTMFSNIAGFSAQSIIEKEFIIHPIVSRIPPGSFCR